MGQNTGAASAGGETAFMAGRPWKCSGGSDPGRKGRRPGTDRQRPVMNEKGNLSEGIEVRAEFQKWISTYTGS